MPEHEWLFRLERAMLKEAPDISLSADFDLEEEVLRSLPGSLAVALIDKVVSVRELIESIMAEAEVIRRRWALM